MDTTFRIGELSELAARAFDGMAIGQHSARVREIPDIRTIRYYTMLGLLDRPVAMKARTALYGPRHLLQLLAIKRLQAQGRSLVEVQTDLTGADDTTLRKCAGVSAAFVKELIEKELKQESSTKGGSGTEVRRAKQRFWSRQPVVTSVSSAEAQPSGNFGYTQGLARPVVLLPISSNVSLLLGDVDHDRLDITTISRLQPAIEVLLQALRSANINVGTVPTSASPSSSQAKETQA